MVDPDQDEKRLYLGLLGSCTAIHINSKEDKSPDFTLFRVTTQDVGACQACLSYCQLTHSPPAAVKECPLTKQPGNHRDSTQPETATG